MDSKVDQVISELSKIDSATENVLKSIDREKKEYTELTENKTKEYNEKLERELQKELDTFRKELDKKNNVVLEQTRKDVDLAIHRLNTSFEKEHSKWTEELFSHLTSTNC